METSVVKLPVNDIYGTPSNIYAMITWKLSPKTVFDIKIFDSNDISWTGRLSATFAEVFSKDVMESVEEYCENVKKCLTNISSLYDYEFHPDGEEAKLTWFKTLDLKQRHGSVLVHKDEVSESKNTLIDSLLQKNMELVNKVSEFNKEIETLTLNLNDSKEELLKFVDAKTSFETGLYEKFVHLLNAKKRRLQLLDQNIQNQKFEKPVYENMSDID